MDEVNGYRSYRCGTCGDGKIVMTVVEPELGLWAWEISCGNGHVWVPVPGTVVVFG
jgi:hypothetical protein